ncbi:hypothetical protein BKN38_02380 [Helicobacter sp. CLO-3]|uniref:hypothetical protein n=1 Tax=unclassified Helicobacter TaxID=2593540 RepID=UPI0008060551|nr:MULTISPECIES: hypothetical protein [unclassified Helicobacter]OBV29446.1 hypothetical protein BA723_00650 [Helicobacter sp. CLO-3]OHU84657.1 hypothetical protein BKN38_02380 [Helicobacter sp. CLO-3]
MTKRAKYAKRSKRAGKSARAKLTSAYALIYAAMILLFVTFILSSLRNSSGIAIDRATNAHINFQSNLYLQSLERIARICAQKQGFLQAEFALDDGFVGGFEIQGSDAFLYIQALNRRTGQTMRATKTITLTQTP